MDPKKLVSPCKYCECFPCDKPGSCLKRQEYVDKYTGTDIMKATDLDGSYRLLVK